MNQRTFTHVVCLCLAASSFAACGGGGGGGGSSTGPVSTTKKEIAIGAASGFPRQWSTGETQVVLQGSVLALEGSLPSKLRLTHSGASTHTLDVPVIVDAHGGDGGWSAHIALDAGDNTISVEPTSGFTHVADAVLYEIASNPGYTFTQAPRAEPDVYFPGIAPLTFTVGVDALLTVVDQVQLYAQRSGEPTELLGAMVDDGASQGDALAGDHIYSFRWDPSGRSLGPIELRVRASRTDAGAAAWSNRIEVLISAAPNQAQFDAEQERYREVRDAIDAANLDGTLATTVTALAQELAADPLVQSVEKFVDSSGIEIRFASGVQALAFPAPSAATGTIGVPQFPTGAVDSGRGPAKLPVEVGGQVVAQLAAYSFSHNELPAMADALDATACLSSIPGLPPPACGDGDINIFKTITNLDPAVILIATHGAVAATKHGRQELLLTNQRCTWAVLQEHAADFKSGRLREVPDPVCPGAMNSVVAIAPDFFRRYAASLPDTIVYVGGCESFKTGGLRDVFFEKGAACYLGFSEPVCSGWATPKAKQFANALALTGSVTSAFIPGQVQPCGGPRDCPHCFPAEFKMKLRPGVTDATIPTACGGPALCFPGLTQLIGGAGDANHDGEDDFVVIHSSDASTPTPFDSRVDLYVDRGATILWSKTPADIMVTHGAVSVGKVDADGVPDLMLAGMLVPSGAGEVVLLSGADGHEITRAGSIGEGGDPYVLGDLNLDGAAEVLLDADSIVIHDGRTGLIRSVIEHEVSFSTARNTIDLDLDGVGEIMEVGILGGVKTVLVYSSSTLEVLYDSRLHWIPLIGNNLDVDVLVGDLDLDALPEFIAHKSNGNLVLVSGADASPLWTGSQGQAFDFGDFDADGALDVVARRIEYPNNVLSVLRADTGDVLDVSPHLGVVLHLGFLGDIDGNGSGDVVYLDYQASAAQQCVGFLWGN